MKKLYTGSGHHTIEYGYLSFSMLISFDSFDDDIWELFSSVNLFWLDSFDVPVIIYFFKKYWKIFKNNIYTAISKYLHKIIINYIWMNHSNMSL